MSASARCSTELSSAEVWAQRASKAIRLHRRDLPWVTFEVESSRDSLSPGVSVRDSATERA